MKKNTIILTIIGSILLLIILLYIIYQFIYYRENTIKIIINLPSFIYKRLKKISSIIFYLLLIPITIYVLYILKNILFFITKSSYVNNYSYSDT